MTLDTIFFRQAHPSCFDNGVLTSQAFTPTTKDEGQLSVYNGDMISAHQSFIHYTTILKLEAQSTWGVSNAEVVATGLAATSNPRENFESHTLIDFRKVSGSQARKIAKQLKQKAIDRGQLYPQV